MGTRLVNQALGWEVTLDTPDEAAAEVARLRTLGATLADIGQGDVSWTVMADPEGNELCVLSPR